jgi:1-acyl-sn-glycerol-3-phosphate acyltransferase
MDEPGRWRPPPLWRFTLAISGPVVGSVCRLRVTGDVPDHGRDGPLILAANHIGAFDPFVLTAACARRRLAPRILATGGLFRAPLVGAAMRAFGHLRVDRRHPTVTDALPVAREALDHGAVVLAYPEGRITLDPGMWPERGKTGLARLAITTRVPVVPVAQWGGHLVLPWGTPHGMIRRLAWALVRHPIVRVHFGAPVPLDDLEPTARDIRIGTDRIIDAITAELRPLRPDEQRLPRWIDPQRPISNGRTHRFRGSSGWPGGAPAT